MSGETRPLTVAVALFERVDDVSASGPAMVFQAANAVEGCEIFRVITVTPGRDPIRSIGGIRMTGDYPACEAPAADILVLPGADGTLEPTRDAAVTAWIDRSLATCRILLTVCTGIRLLASRGLTAGLEVTSHPDAVAVMAEAAPGARVRTDRVCCDNGRIVAASGLTGGLEASLCVVARLRGAAVAARAARRIEYRPAELGKEGTRRPPPAGDGAP